MRCIYFNGESCRGMGASYEPSDEEKEKLCETTEFRSCERIYAHLARLKAAAKRD